MCVIYRRSLCVETCIKMKWLSALILGMTLGQTHVRAEEAPQALPKTNTLRVYPGGRDESDLTVQPKRKIARKNEDLDLEHYESESSEAGHQATENFGE
jgi:hypothetical protein